ncbi:LuxR C-terminal-related transcriptional regulator [Amycolatopsis lurida]|uniref:LuxR C-terminal-related transcriptional regulator n=1 Tax=Amycolatopsis lurida TaxID=31959 RepID=UPI00365CC2C7
MSDLPPRLDPLTTTLLREAYHKILALGGDRFAVYDQVRRTLAKIAHIDSFYIGLLHGQNKVRYVYGTEDQKFDDPVLNAYGPNGPVAWLLRHRQTYRFFYDQGAVLSAGTSFGDVTRESADVVTVPMFRPEKNAPDSVIGMVSLHSYTPDVYDDHAVRAVEWLTAALARIIVRQEEDRLTLHHLTSDEEGHDALTSHRVLEYLSGHISGIRTTAREVIETPGPALEDTLRALREVMQRCERIQYELIDMTSRADLGPATRFAALTPSESTVALLIARGMGNQDMATELGLSVNTIKTHVRNILRKYDAPDRDQVAADVRRHLQ